MSEKIKHTEGPFRVPVSNLFRVVKPVEDPRSKDHPWIPLAEMIEHETISGEEMAENAILFAAAPQMEHDIAALREREERLVKLLREAQSGIERLHEGDCGGPDVDPCRWCKLRAAIGTELRERPWNQSQSRRHRG